MQDMEGAQSREIIVLCVKVLCHPFASPVDRIMPSAGLTEDG